MNNAALNETATNELVLTRELDAPRDLVYKAWTEADRLKEWWGPSGFYLGVDRLELQPGGTFLYSMQAGNGPKLWGKFVYREVAAPERIVFVNSFSDENAGLLRAPFSETWPLEMLNTLNLTELDGKTTLTLHVAPENATPEEEKTFREGFDSMRQGFGGTFDKLEAYLAKAQS